MALHSGQVKDRVMRTMVRLYGWDAALRFCCNLGISFEDCYYMCFGKEPRNV